MHTIVVTTIQRIVVIISVASTLLVLTLTGNAKALYAWNE